MVGTVPRKRARSLAWRQSHLSGVTCSLPSPQQVLCSGGRLCGLGTVPNSLSPESKWWVGMVAFVYRLWVSRVLGGARSPYPGQTQLAAWSPGPSPGVVYKL